VHYYCLRLYPALSFGIVELYLYSSTKELNIVGFCPPTSHKKTEAELLKCHDFNKKHKKDILNNRVTSPQFKKFQKNQLQTNVTKFYTTLYAKSVVPSELNVHSDRVV
jgi:hypothetical protein